MNDSFDGKNGKVKVMYVRSDAQKRQKKRPTNRFGDAPRRDVSDSVTRHRRTTDRRHDKVYSEKPFSYDSPWKTLPPASITEEQQVDHGGISGKSQIDPEQLRRQRMEETKVYGENACQALFSNRPQALVRAWFAESVTPRFRETLRWMAANHKAYHVVDDEELAKASGTEHHGGVCFLIKKRQSLDATMYLQQAPQTDCVLALDIPGNPYNLGGIIRSGAHFGVNAVLLQDPNLLESGAAIRTAEGGAEYIQAINASDFLSTLNVFRNAGYAIVIASDDKGTPLLQAQLPARMVLVLSHGHHELADRLWQQGNLNVSIEGTNRVGLNISVTAGVVLAQWWHQNTVK